MVSLILITSALASCSKPQQEEKQKVYMRADSSAPYTEVTQEYSKNNSNFGMGSALLWYMAFRPMMGGNGYMSNGIATKSNVGTNTAKNNAMKAQTARGGFGSSAKSSASS